VSGSISYDVWRKQGSDCSGAVKVTSSPVAGTAYPDSGLACNLPYSYFITANNACGTSSSGACATTTTAACPVPLRVPYSVVPTKVTTPNHGADGTVTWDIGNCSSAGYHLVYGMGDDIASLNTASPVVGGVQCAIGISGSYAWAGVPDPSSYSSRFLWFLVVGDDGAVTEGSWGLTSAGQEEGRGTASAHGCCSAKDTSHSCGTP